MITLRRADKDPDSLDSRLVWQWRADPVTRRMSKTTDLIPWEDHQRWYARTAADPQRVLLIASLDGEPSCMVRFDCLDAERAEISINMNPAHRGKGQGRPILAAACAHGFEILKLRTLCAQIRIENAPSLKIFESVGFRLQGEHQGLRTYSLEHS